VGEVDSGLLRDFVIIITGGLMLVMLVILGIVGFLIYGQITALMKSVKDTIHTAQEMSAEVKETVKSSKTLINLFKGQPSRSESKSSSPT
jgi:hypothetical protein